jgi:hypothetical protein
LLFTPDVRWEATTNRAEAGVDQRPIAAGAADDGNVRKTLPQFRVLLPPGHPGCLNALIAGRDDEGVRRPSLKE